MSKLGQLRCAMGAVRAALPMSIWIAVNGLAIYYISIAAGRLELGELAFRAVFGLFSIFAGLGGVWFFWGLADGIDFWRLGYRIRYVKPVSRSPDLSEPRTYVYEERDADGRIRSMPFARRFLDTNYPAASELYFPGADVWDIGQPDWARERRTEIMQRARELCGPATRLSED